MKGCVLLVIGLALGSLIVTLVMKPALDPDLPNMRNVRIYREVSFHEDGLNKIADRAQLEMEQAGAVTYDKKDADLIISTSKLNVIDPLVSHMRLIVKKKEDGRMILNEEINSEQEWRVKRILHDNLPKAEIEALSRKRCQDNLQNTRRE